MTSPLGQGHSYQELRWGDDMDPSAAETDTDLESLVQDVLHIIAEQLASNIADPDSGVGVVNYLSGTNVNLATLPGIIDAQLSNVSRISSSATTITLQADGTYLILVAVQYADSVVNLPFTVGPNGVTPSV